MNLVKSCKNAAMMVVCVIVMLLCLTKVGRSEEPSNSSVTLTSAYEAAMRGARKEINACDRAVDYLRFQNKELERRNEESNKIAGAAGIVGALSGVAITIVILFAI